jgi:hypothetical protein
MANLISFAVEESDELITQADANKNLKYKRKANRSRCIKKFRKKFLRIIFEINPDIYNKLLESLIADIAKHPVPVVPDRSPPCKTPRKKRFYQNRRSVV